MGMKRIAGQLISLRVDTRFVFLLKLESHEHSRSDGGFRLIYGVQDPLAVAEFGAVVRASVRAGHDSNVETILLLKVYKRQNP